MFGIGPWELIIILAMGAIFAAVAVFVVALAMRGRSGVAGHDAYSQLVEENRRLREELAALQRKL